MLRLGVTFLLLALSLSSFSQQYDNYRRTVDSLYKIIGQLPSFKEQVTGKKLASYDSLVNVVKNDTAGISSDYDIFFQLVKLLFPFSDNHVGLYHPATDILDASEYKDTSAINRYYSNKNFKQFPYRRLDVDSLERTLKMKSKSVVEGIYFYDSLLTIGLYKTKEPGKYEGIVLSTALPNWIKGQVAVTLFEYHTNCYRAVYAHLQDKALIWYPNEKFVNESLIQFGYKKTPFKKDFSIDDDRSLFVFKYISNSIQYLKLGSFSASPDNIKTVQAFFTRIKDSLTAPRLIVDLRGNTGGAYNVAVNFLNLVKRYAEKGKVIVLVNFFTMSEGERFALRLKNVHGITVAGQTTMGTIAYGSNRGEWRPFAGGKFFIYPTDMNGNDFLSYENVGVKPHIYLNSKRDWIEQVLSK